MREQSYYKNLQLDPLDPDPDLFGCEQDFVLQIFGQHLVPAEHSESLLHFGLQLVIWLDNGQSPGN